MVLFAQLGNGSTGVQYLERPVLTSVVYGRSGGEGELFV
jgi:hypothetical protein